MPGRDATPSMTGRIVFAVAVVAAFVAGPIGASAAPAKVPVPASAKTPSKIPAAAASVWALDAAVPSFARTGCLVCHADPNLVVSKEGTANVNLSIDMKAFNASVHAKIACADCHSNFGYKAPHKVTDWRAVAKQSCVNCKDHRTQFLAYESGSHAVKPTFNKKPDPKAAEKPLCGDCHGSHAIAKLKDSPAAQAALRAEASTMCGRAGCHEDYWDNYNDYWHGAAYKTGAPDAPVCWDCHGQHTVLPSKDPNSSTNAAGLARGCGKCHQGAGPAQEAYVKIIHGRAALAARNPLRKILASVIPWLR